MGALAQGKGLRHSDWLDWHFWQNQHQDVQQSSFDPIYHKFTLAYVWLTAGQTIRAVISWDGCPKTGIQYRHGNAAHADLDLRILDPWGTHVAYGNSYDQTYEITEYTATHSGTHTLWVKKFGWADCPELGGSSNAKTFLGYAYDVQ